MPDAESVQKAIKPVRICVVAVRALQLLSLPRFEGITISFSLFSYTVYIRDNLLMSQWTTSNFFWSVGDLR